MRTSYPDARRRGMSLLHLLLVLTILSMSASVAILGWFERDVVTLDSAALLLADDLRDAQNRAAFQRRKLYVHFQPDGSGYAIRDAAGKPVSAPIGKGPFQRHYARDAVFRGVEVSELRLGGGRVVLYDTEGAALTLGEIDLSFRGATRTIRIADRGGRIEIDGLRRDWSDREY